VLFDQRPHVERGAVDRHPSLILADLDPVDRVVGRIAHEGVQLVVDFFHVAGRSADVVDDVVVVRDGVIRQAVESQGQAAHGGRNAGCELAEGIPHSPNLGKAGLAANSLNNPHLVDVFTRPEQAFSVQELEQDVEQGVDVVLHCLGDFLDALDIFGELFQVRVRDSIAGAVEQVAQDAGAAAAQFGKLAA